MGKVNQDLRNDPRYQNHESRPDLAGEHPKGDTWQFIAAIIFVAAIIIDYSLLKNPQKNSGLISIWVRFPLALLFLISSGWLSFRGIHEVFSEYREEPVILTEGLFRYMRHPIYLGAIFFYLAVLILTLSPLALIVWIGVLVLYQWLAVYEEKRMLALFGKAYQNYQQQVPMWLPIKFK
ncbi:MAG: isoprenylcysteine carboxylmethyltransferase family protein [Anaerolineae bacterium]|mgnify:CR=1 FL=1|nr:isoprenylcysteine carboxylmethyltransferase family protein [Anaerolineae bacterium]